VGDFVLIESAESLTMACNIMGFGIRTSPMRGAGTRMYVHWDFGHVHIVFNST
jgi:hypothetical protein